MNKSEQLKDEEFNLVQTVQQETLLPQIYIHCAFYNEFIISDYLYSSNHQLQCTQIFVVH